jgi:glycosyltransferase 2 family protein
MIRLLKIAVSAGLIALLVQRFDLSAIVAAFSALSGAVIALALLLQGAALCLSAYKWRQLLPSVPFQTLLHFSLVGQFYAIVLPGQFTGEVAKAYRLGAHAGDMHRVASSVLIDRITGLVGLLAVALAGILLSSASLPNSFVSMTILFIVLGLFALWAASLDVVHAWILRFCKRVAPGRFATAHSSLERFFSAYRSSALDRGLMARSILLGILFQLLAVAITALLAHDLGLSVMLADWLWIFGAISLVVLLPVTFGGIGLREGAFAGILAWLGHAPAAAVALSLSIFALQLVYALIGGLLEGQAHFFHKRS